MSGEIQKTFSSISERFADLPAEVRDNLAAVHNGKMTDQGLKEAIVRLRGSGVPVRTVCQALKCSPHTVQVAEREHPELMATVKERTAQAWELVQTMCAEGLIERLQAGALKPGEMGLTGGIAGTKAAELRGEATVRVSVEVLPSAEEMEERAKRLVEKVRVIDV